MRQRYRVAYWITLAVAALLLWSGSFSVPLTDPDESRFARTSVEMLRSGDLVVPRFEGSPRLVKPPLLHWIQTALFSVLGTHEWVARLPAALATLATLLLLGSVARRRFGDEGAFWAVATLATMPVVMVIGRLGTLDSLLALHVFAAVSFDLASPETERPYSGLALGGILGLAFLVKGPVGVVLPLVVMLCGRTAIGREILPSRNAMLQSLAGLAAVVLPWGLTLIRRVGAGEVVRLLRTEALERYFAGTAHVEPPWFYVPVLAVGCAPWIVPLLAGLARALRMRRDPVARTALYAAAGFLGGLVFFSLGRGKLPNYLLPLMPLAALVVAWELGQLLRAPGRRRIVLALLTATPGLLAAALLGLGGTRLDGEMRTVALAGGAIQLAGCLACLPFLLKRRPRGVFGAVAVSAAAFLLLTLSVLPAQIARERSAARLTEVVPELNAPRPLVLVALRVPSLTYYLDRVPEHVSLADLPSRLDRDDDPLFVVADVDLPAIPPSVLSRLHEIGRQAKFVVLEKARGPGAPRRNSQ